MRMAQEEHFLRCDYSGGASDAVGGGGAPGGSVICSNSRSKKIKQKKVPQRGLGVAQLEKIRLEEQQKKEALHAANILAHNVNGSHSDSNPCLGLLHSPKSFSLPPTPSANLSSPNSVYRPTPSAPCIEFLQNGSVQISNRGGGEVGLPVNLSPKHVNWPKPWNGEYNLEGVKQKFDHHGFSFRPQLNVVFESNASPVVTLPNVPQSLPPFQQSSAASMVNASSGISSSTALNSQMEPPSNQSFRSNSNCTPSRPEEEKMVGMKRTYPFLLDGQSAPSFHSNHHPTYGLSRSRSDDLISCSNGYIARFELKNREGPSHSSPLPEPEQYPTEFIKARDDERLCGDFLTLAPPEAAAASPPLNSKHVHPSDSSCPEEQELYEIKCLPGQDIAKSQIHWLAPSRSRELQPFSFIPVKSQMDQSSTSLSHGNGVKGEIIDLNLKL